MVPRSGGPWYVTGTQRISLRGCGYAISHVDRHACHYQPRLRLPLLTWQHVLLDVQPGRAHFRIEERDESERSGDDSPLVLLIFPLALRLYP